jgi:hypothetical protein
VTKDSAAVKIRLHGIDCPKKGQRAKQFTSSLEFGQEVIVKPEGLDRYRRTIGIVLFPDGRNLNQQIVRLVQPSFGATSWKTKLLNGLKEKPETGKHGLCADAESVSP